VSGRKRHADADDAIEFVIPIDATVVASETSSLDFGAAQ